MSRADIHTLYFDDLADAARFARDTPRADFEQPRTTSEEKENHEWDLGMPLADALDTAAGLESWDGVTGMMEAMEITDELAARALMPGVKRHLVGGSVNVGAYLTGHPRCMRRRVPQPGVDRPVLTIGVSLGIAWIVTAQTRLNFGAAVLSMVDQLERSGYRCEIIAFWRGAQEPYGDSFDKWLNIEYTLKRPDEMWNPSSIAFAVAHPAFQRRMTWRIAETQIEYERALSCYVNHSNSKALLESLAQDYDIFFPNFTMDENKACSTPDRAFNFVQQTVNAQLERAKRGAEAV